jgi:hypothetical protein
MTLISDCQSPEVLKPGKKPFGFPAAFMPPELSAVLSFWLRAVAAMRRNQLDAVLFQKIIIERIAVTGFAPTSFSGIPVTKRLSTAISAGFTSWVEELARQTETGRPEASAIAMIRLTLPRFVRPAAPPLFLPEQRRRL